MVRLAQFSPVQADRKVCLIPRAETLTPEAANALLKILEEPPRDLAFVVLTEHPSDLLPTIVSRCRMIRVPPPARDVIARRLTEAGYTEDDAAWLGGIALRDGDLERLIAERIDVVSAREEATAELCGGPAVELIGAALDEDPIRRHEALLFLVARIGAQDTETLTVGVRTLAQQDREILARFLLELLSASFDLLRSTSARPDDRSAASEIRERIGDSRLRALCRAIDAAYRSIVVYGPPEAVLLSLMLTPGGDVDGE